MAEGQTTKQIARNLNISVKTVESHRSRLTERLNIHDIAGLVRFALRTGLVNIVAACLAVGHELARAGSSSSLLNPCTTSRQAYAAFCLAAVSGSRMRTVPHSTSGAKGFHKQAYAPAENPRAINSTPLSAATRTMGIRRRRFSDFM